MTMSADRVLNARAFRNALGEFPTGVTVITALDRDQHRAVGMTISSFNSVSLDPPLVLWSLVKSSPNLHVFEVGCHHVIHILGAHQRDLASRFATPGINKFESVALREPLSDAVPPVIDGCAAHFFCTVESRIDGGDHVIVVASVQRFDHMEPEPLVFHRGRFATLDLRTS